MSRYLLNEAPQGSDEWKLARAGKATGSKAACILAQGRTKGTEATTRKNYRVQLVTERLTGIPQEDGYVSDDMRAGTANEPMARLEYEAAKPAVMVREAGFAYLPELPAGCSVDGFLDDDADGFGLLEIKCPKSAQHITYLQEARLPPDYVPQTTHNAWITGAAFVDFVSFDPRMPEKLRLFTVRIYRAEFDLTGYEAELMKFLGEVSTLEDSLRKRAA